MATYELNGLLFADMIRGGVGNLRTNAQTVNDLNVFPIPDGDTGDNMCLTMEGGDAAIAGVASESISYIADKLAGGMLLGARGNSGVILSQLFAGIAKGLDGVERADAAALGRAFRTGVKQAYDAVLTPTEGTILTVAREATEYAVSRITPESTLEDFFSLFIEKMHDSLRHTPELLPILKESGVIDSGGAGLVYIIEGMNKILHGEKVENTAYAPQKSAPAPDLSAFTADSVMEFGYCTEFLLQLQNSKVNAEEFPVEKISEELTALGGESIVAFKTGTVVKVHVHTMFPWKVFEACQKYGEFLTVKVENMALQHSEAKIENRFEEKPAKQEHKSYGVVAVATGEGIKETFHSLGADVIVEGGQTMNPSSEDFLAAFDEVNADTVFVFPNNSNIILTARQAAAMYEKSDVRVLDSKTVGDGYAALTMMDFESGDTDAIVQNMNESMQGVITGMVTRSVRDSHLGGIEIAKNDYIGFAGKQMLSDDPTVAGAATGLLSGIDMTDREVIIAICGKDCTAADMDAVRAFIHRTYPQVELYEIDGGQDIYHFIFVVE